MPLYYSSIHDRSAHVPSRALPWSAIFITCDIMVICTQNNELGHVFILGKEPFFVHGTTAELQKLQSQFFHPSVGKLVTVLSHPRPKYTSEELIKTLESIIEPCATCAELHVPPFRFRDCLPEDQLQFNMAMIDGPVMDRWDTGDAFRGL